MVTEEERREIIEQAKEEILLALPAVVGNLMTSHAALAKINSEFYKTYPEFREHKSVVVSVLEKLDGDDPIGSYEEKLKKAVPLIKERIRVSGQLDMQRVPSEPNRSFKPSGNGVL